MGTVFSQYLQAKSLDSSRMTPFSLNNILIGRIAYGLIGNQAPKSKENGGMFCKSLKVALLCVDSQTQLDLDYPYTVS